MMDYISECYVTKQKLKNQSTLKDIIRLVPAYTNKALSKIRLPKHTAARPIPTGYLPQQNRGKALSFVRANL